MPKVISTPESKKADAIRAANGIAQSMIDSGVNPRYGETQPDQPLLSWLAQYVTEQIDRDQIITPLMQTQGWGPAALNALFGDGPYENPKAKVRLKNVSNSPIQIVAETKKSMVPVKVARTGGVQVTIQGKEERVSHTLVELAPGEEYDLKAERAAAAMQRHCQSAWPPDLWGVSSAIPQGNPLEEVAFTVLDLDGFDGEAESKSWRKKKRAQ